MEDTTQFGGNQVPFGANGRPTNTRESEIISEESIPTPELLPPAGFNITSPLQELQETFEREVAHEELLENTVDMMLECEARIAKLQEVHSNVASQDSSGSGPSKETKEILVVEPATSSSRQIISQLALPVTATLVQNFDSLDKSAGQSQSPNWRDARSSSNLNRENIMNWIQSEVPNLTKKRRISGDSGYNTSGTPSPPMIRSTPPLSSNNVENGGIIPKERHYCKFCDKSYSTKYSLKGHVEKQHSNSDMNGPSHGGPTPIVQQPGGIFPRQLPQFNPECSMGQRGSGGVICPNAPSHGTNMTAGGQGAPVGGPMGYGGQVHMVSGGPFSPIVDQECLVDEVPWVQ